jgi:hypothetical protein
VAWEPRSTSSTLILTYTFASESMTIRIKYSASGSTSRHSEQCAHAFRVCTNDLNAELSLLPGFVPSGVQFYDRRLDRSNTHATASPFAVTMATGKILFRFLPPRSLLDHDSKIYIYTYMSINIHTVYFLNNKKVLRVSQKMCAPSKSRLC